MKLKTEKDLFSPGWFEKHLDRIEKERGEYIKSRWYVVEVSPSTAYRHGDGHGGSEVSWTIARSRIVSQYFDKSKDAREFMDKYDPDDGKHFEIKEERLYRRTVEQWY